MPDVSRSNMTFTSNLQPIGDEDYSESVFLSKIRDPFALDYMHHQKFKMLPVQEEEYRKASGHCSYAFEKDYPWGTVIDTDGSEKLLCKCQNTECSQFGICNPGFELKDLTDLIENEINAFLRYSNANQKRGKKWEHREKVSTQELEEAYRRVLTASPAEQTETATAEVEADQADGMEVLEETQKDVDIPAAPAEESEEVLESIPAAVQTVHSEVQQSGFERFVHTDHDTVLNAGPKERMLINAGPGTGKTWTLIHKIASLVQNEEIEPEDVLVLSFSRAAVEEIEKRLKEAELKGELSSRWHRIDFSTLDSFATRMILYAMQNEPDLLPKDYSLVGQDYDERIETARAIIKKQPDILETNVHVLIDEIQDLVGCRAKLVLNILHILNPECGFTLLGDACQSLYDYQAEIDPTVLSSAQFYRFLFTDFPDIRYYRFDENHRQNEWLKELITPYRDAILTGSPEERRTMVFKIRKQILDSMIDLKDPDPEKISLLTKSGPVAILTRSNGEALKVSEYLKTAGIKHRLERPDTEEQMNDWIAVIFTQYPNETINHDLFCSFAEKLKPDFKGAGMESCWKALLENVPEEGPWYHVSIILETMLRRGKNRALFRNGQEETGLTVSNIHRAKGKEYDTVLIPEHSLEGLSTDIRDPVNEHKVCYVACTRPKKSLKTARLKNVYISREKNTGRCYEGKFKNGKSGQRLLINLEVGLPGDIDILSLANEATQAYIRDEMQQDERLVFIKEIVDGKARYSIRPENRQELILGYTSVSFSNAIERIKHILVKKPGRFDPIYYPAEMDNIVVTKKTSCIVTGDQKQEGIKYYGSTGIWFGFAVTGFAHIVTNRY